MKPQCRFCAALIEEEPPRGYGYFRCSHGHFDIEAKPSGEGMIPQWFAWSGIWRPNKSVAKAQESCRDFQEHPKVLRIGWFGRPRD